MKSADSAVTLRIVFVPGDHHSIVGAELGRRTDQTKSGRLSDDGQNLPDVLVTRHASGQHLEKFELSVDAVRFCDVNIKINTFKHVYNKLLKEIKKE